MSSFLIGPSLMGVIRLVSSTLLAGLVASPMSWSPEGEWLSYTVVSRPNQVRLQSPLFDASCDVVTAASPTFRPPPWSGLRPSAHERTLDNGQRIYQLWATNRDGRQSVLIAQSESPLSAPSWSPLGRAVAYGRFVPQSIESDQPLDSLRGRYEVVVQDRLDRAQVVLVVPRHRPGTGGPRR